MILIFALYWIVYRYNVLYVFQFRNDTGGLLFPKAVNQLYTGLYVMELCLIGFFISAEDCVPHLIIMIVALILTVLYQWQLNVTFDPLFQYLPITLEDEAVIRDEQFAKLQDEKFREHGKEPSNRYVPLKRMEHSGVRDGTAPSESRPRSAGCHCDC